MYLFNITYSNPIYPKYIQLLLKKNLNVQVLSIQTIHFVNNNDNNK